jgi:AcrR family transcriptional regulator
MTNNDAAQTLKAETSMTMEVRPAQDGRRRRGQNNRARIIAAMLDLTRSGAGRFSAEQVAAQAQVGLRTVFRHFQDMDSLYREMSSVIEAELKTIADRPLKAAGWRGRLMELIERRAMAFEKIGPFAIASTGYRQRSKFLQADHARLVKILRAVVEAELPTNPPLDPADVEVLDLLLSFEAWSRLRREQGLSVKDAQNALKSAVSRMIID